MSKAENKLAEELVRKISEITTHSIGPDAEDEWFAKATAILEPHLVGEWLPIESAPKDWDAPQVLVYNPTWDVSVQLRRLDKNDKWPKGYEPTHWHPLPASPPKGEQSA